MEIIISIKDVIEVTNKELIYKNKLGEMKKISFDECKTNWVDYVNANGFVDWNGNRVHLSPHQSNCIGTRNKGKVPYLLLYGNDKVKIELAYDDYHRLTKLQKELPRVLYEVGVTTFDMT